MSLPQEVLERLASKQPRPKLAPPCRRLSGHSCVRVGIQPRAWLAKHMGENQLCAEKQFPQRNAAVSAGVRQDVLNFELGRLQVVAGVVPVPRLQAHR